MAIQVRKTLVIGLGSTGTEICDSLYKRLRWQYSGIENLPWLRFLCIETNEDKRTALRKDFIAIGIDKHSFIDYKDNPHRHQERMLLPLWLDRRALEDLKADFVSGGAGNIRMIGRLAFFHNYAAIKRAVVDRIEGVRRCTVNEAQERLRSLGVSDEIEFAADGAVRVFIVGSLTGGTCSGCIADMGFLAQSVLAKESDCVYALLGAPSAALSEADERLAERFKKNAWHGLVELNHYCLPGKEFPPIQYPGDIRVTESDAPFFAVFVFQPEGTAISDIERLNAQIAECIYLSIFSQAVDPKEKAVDMYFRLCSQGLAVIEFPAQRTVEACAKRLLSEGLDEWLSTSGSDRLHAEIGIDWKWLRRQCTTTDAGDNLVDEVHQGLRTAAERLDKLDVDEAERQIDRVAQKFRGGGSIRSHVAARIAGLPKLLQDQITDSIKRSLREIEYGGPHNFVDALRRVSRFLAEIQQRGGGGGGRFDIEDSLARLRRISRSWLLFLMGLRRHAAKPVVGQIRSSLQSQYEEEIDRVIFECARVSNIVPQCEGILSQFIRRFEKLQRRAREQQQLLQQDWQRLAKEEPVVCGYSLFESAHDPNNDGTVHQEYRAALERHDPSPAKNWLNGKVKAMAETIRSLPEQLHDVLSAREGNWLDDDLRPEGDPPLPDDIVEPMLKRAATVFSQIYDVDVLTRWHFSTNRNARAEAIFQLCRPSVQVDRSRATQAGKSPPLSRSLLLLPPSPYREEFLDATSHRTRGFHDEPSPDAHTVVALQQDLGLNLDAILSVIGQGGLHTAQCGDFNVWHTRKDVDWRIPEVELGPAVEDLRGKIVAGLLLGLLELRERSIVMRVDDPVQGEVALRLPWNTQDAAARVKSGKPDLQGESLARFEELLDERLGDRLRNSKSPDGVYIELVKGLRERRARQVPDYGSFRRLLIRYCKLVPELNEAMMRINRPSEETRRAMWKEEGALLPGSNQPATAAGFYCVACGAAMGATEQEAEAWLWTCPVCSRYHGREA